MSEYQRPPSCSTCGKPLPCVLHDRKTREAILSREEELPGLEMTKEWERRTRVQIVAVLKDGRVLEREGDGIYALDLKSGTLDATPVFSNVEVAEQLSDEKIVLIDRDRVLKVVDFSKDPPHAEIVKAHSPQEHSFNLVRLSDKAVVVRLYESERFVSDLDDEFFNFVVEPRPNVIGQRRFLSRDQGMMKNAGDGKVLIIDKLGTITLYDDTWKTSHPLRVEGDPKSDPYDFIVADQTVVISDSVMNRIVYFRLDDMKPHEQEIEGVERDRYVFEKLSDHTLFAVGMERGAVLRIHLSGPHPIVTELARAPRAFSLRPLTETSILVSTKDGAIQLWEIPEAKTRAYHERQAATADEELPELPEV